nr:MAG TPA: hypothetical protein [Caudoviricetes sp.]
MEQIEETVNWAIHEETVKQLLKARLLPAVEDVSDALEDFDEEADEKMLDPVSLRLYDKTLVLVNALRKAGLLYTDYME